MMILRLFVVCTDAGQHARVRLGELELIEPDGVLRAGMELRRLPVRKPPDRPTVWIDDRNGVHMRCPRCNRDVPWRGNRARDAVRGFNRAGFDTFDLSHHS